MYNSIIVVYPASFILPINHLKINIFLTFLQKGFFHTRYKRLYTFTIYAYSINVTSGGEKAWAMDTADTAVAVAVATVMVLH